MNIAMPATNPAALRNDNASAVFHPVTADTVETVEISFKNFQFYYGKYHALKNINLDIYKRRVTAFIGPSHRRPNMKA